MKEDSESGFSSQEFASELDTLLDFRSGVLDTQAKETAQLTQLDSPELQAQLYRRAYYEVNYDTLPKQLLWSAENHLSSIKPQASYETFMNYRLQNFDENILMIDVIEAYGRIMPMEGYSRLVAMEDGPTKVEAMAKFGIVTDPDFVVQARTLAEKLGYQDRYRSSRYKMLLSVAEFGNDDQSLDMAYRDLLPNGVTSYNEWSDFSTILKIASLGHMPAQLVAKKDLPRNYHDGHESHQDEWIYEAAQLEYIDELVRRRIIPSRIVGLDAPEAEAQRIEKDWQDFVLAHKDQIIAVLKQGVTLPKFDAMNNEFNTHTSYGIDDYSIFSQPSDVLDYIDAQTQEYAARIAEDGLEAVPRLITAGTIAVTDQFKIPRQKIKDKYDYYRSDDAPMVMRIVMRRDHKLEDEIASSYKNYKEIMGFLNRLAVVKGTIQAATQLQAGTKPPSA